MTDIIYTPEEQEYMRLNKSNAGYHYLGSAKKPTAKSARPLPRPWLVWQKTSRSEERQEHQKERDKKKEKQLICAGRA
jgi:hypothetical protein